MSAGPLRARLEAARAAHGPDSDLLPLDAMAALAASDQDDAEHAAQLARIFAHPLMAAEYAALRAVVEAARPEEADEPLPVAPAPPRRRRSGLVWAVAMLVMAIVMLLLRARG